MSGLHVGREMEPLVPSGATPRLPSPASLTPLQRAIILTLLYSDLFDYPLTDAEVRRYLPADCPPSDAWDRALTPMIGQWVSRADDYFMMAGRESIVETRRERHAQGDRLWRWAERYAAWMGRVPFVRMVGVCGSLAAGNATADADVDLFIITAENRLWTVQVWAMTLRRLASCVGVRVCPNYFLTLDSLRVEPRTLYTAREVAQVVPLYGVETYARFFASNPWVQRLLPNVGADDGRPQSAPPTSRLGATRVLEWGLAGRVGDLLERILYRMLLLYYPRRRAGEGWRRTHFVRAYRRDRQTVVGGGYGPAIERAFRQRVAAWFGSVSLVPELDVLFPASPAVHETSHTNGVDAEPGVYGQLFAERYGRDHE